jgi:hypothetical protein
MPTRMRLIIGGSPFCDPRYHGLRGGLKRGRFDQRLN